MLPQSPSIHKSAPPPIFPTVSPALPKCVLCPPPPTHSSVIAPPPSLHTLSPPHSFAQFFPSIPPMWVNGGGSVQFDGESADGAGADGMEVISGVSELGGINWALQQITPCFLSLLPIFSFRQPFKHQLRAGPLQRLQLVLWQPSEVVAGP